MRRFRSAVILVSSVVSWAVLAAWLMSYFIGIDYYRSEWSQSGTRTFEKARWVISNYGSIGFAKRDQQLSPRFDELPVDESHLRRIPPSVTHRDNVHPPGKLAWHWFHWQYRKNARGASSNDYGHLFVPYWAVFCALVFVSFLAYAAGSRS